MLQKLPVGIQTFSEIIEEDYLYVDKTKQIYDLITTSKTYFLSRPRRFGKSLLISTLTEIFKGNKKLFQGLYLEKTDYNWTKYPVIRIDFSSICKDSVMELKNGIKRELERIANKYQIKLQENSVIEYFKSLIIELSQINKVIILIDEYDAPLIHHISKNEELAIEIREFLKSFYTVIKGEDQYLKFVFLTGVSKFSKVGVFSGLNQLQDITMDARFCDLVGWTQKELENNFSEQIKTIATKENSNKKNIIEKIKFWYNGYRFTQAETKVYNPFSTLLLFSRNSFEFHWFETGTPTFLVNLLKQNQNTALEEILSNKVTSDAFASYEIEQLDPCALLFQTGYLTINKVQKTDFEYLYNLSFPNFEVKNAFSRNLLQGFSGCSPSLSYSYLEDLIIALRKKNFDDFFQTLKIFFANIPYSIQLSNEKYYQTIFYLIFSLIGIRVKAEVCTNNGRIDAVIALEEGIYLFEFKLQGTKEEAISQIKKKKYYEKYGGRGTVPRTPTKNIYLIGVEFDQKERNIGEFLIENI